MSICIFTEATCQRHEMGPGHPESPLRLKLVEGQLRNSQLSLQWQNPKLASQKEIRLAHQAAYVDEIFSIRPQTGLHFVDGDTAMNAWSLEAARYAAGASISAVDLVLGGFDGTVFSLTRPPGHHAERHRGMGFCLFNNVAIAALYALQQPGIERVAVVDFDVHHGNGSEDILGGHPDVLLCSSFQHPLYPHSGLQNLPGNVLTAPLAAGSDGNAIAQVMQERFIPAIVDFKPHMILVSAGFDAHRDDPLGGLNWTEQDYFLLGRQLANLADFLQIFPIFSTLEGGYNLPALARSVQAYLQGLENIPL